MGKPTSLLVKNLSKPKRYGDGLYLDVAPSGAESWVQR